MWRSAVQVCLGLHIARLVQCAQATSLQVTHRTMVQCVQATSLWDYTSHDSEMCTGSVDVAFNIVDDSIKLYHKFETLYWGISSVG